MLFLLHTKTLFIISNIMNALTDKINDFQQNSGEIAAESAGGSAQ